MIVFLVKYLKQSVLTNYTIAMIINLCYSFNELVLDA